MHDSGVWRKCRCISECNTDELLDVGGASDERRIMLWITGYWTS